MGLVTRLIFLALTVGPAVLVYKLLFEPHPRPIVEDEYWGPKSRREEVEDTTVRPFKINISAEEIDDLRARLKRELDSNRLLPPLENVAFEMGFNSKYLKTVGEYWLNKYDWRAREKLLNKYPHFKTKIGGLDIHFQHIKPEARDGHPPRPLLLVHGWPGSIVEFQKIIPLLTEPNDSKYNYELVIPSLPGYGWSEAAARKGMSPTEMANILKRLMKRLGHNRFYITGGDWGGIITTEMATIYPDNIIAAQSDFCICMTIVCHLRYFVATLAPPVFMPGESGKNVLPFYEYLKTLIFEFGYAHLQGTKPETVGAGLTHSPLGLASYFLEKFSFWTDRKMLTREDGGITEKFTLDELLDNVMVYWTTSSITSSMRLYSELLDFEKRHQTDRVPTSVPFSCQFLPNEFLVLPEFALRDKYLNLTYSVANKGGHFGAFEVPELVAESLISYFDKN